MSSDSSLLSNTLSNHTKSDNEPIERGRNENSFYESNDSEFIEEEMIILVSTNISYCNRDQVQIQLRTQDRPLLTQNQPLRPKTTLI